MNVRFIGDVHAKFSEYVELTKTAERSVQVGDFGIGFGIKEPRVSSNHKFIRGNHDNLQKCRKIPNFIEDLSYNDDIFYIGGAFSIDKFLRTEGVDWWPDEELSIANLNKAIDLAESLKPKVIVSHDCPLSIAQIMFNCNPITSRTAQALDSIFEVHNPQYWIFGHWHKSKTVTLSNTRFVCLNELETLDLCIN